MTYSHLTVGTSKIPARPPRGQPPCTEPVVYGSNVLKDPGFELQLSNFSGGPEGSEIPGVSLGNGVPYIWVGGTDAGLRSIGHSFTARPVSLALTGIGKCLLPIRGPALIMLG